MTDMDNRSQNANSATAGKTGETRKRLRGFASMDRALLRQISSKGGKVAHERGRAHEFTPEEARLARRKGVLAAQKRASINHGEEGGLEPSAGRGAMGVRGDTPMHFENNLDPGSMIEAQKTLETINHELGHEDE